MSGSVSTRTTKYDGGLRDRQRAVEVAVDLRRGAGEVDLERVARDGHRAAHGQVARLVRGRRPRARRRRGRCRRGSSRSRARAALGVVEHLRHRALPAAPRPWRSASSLEAPCGEPVGGQLGAQVGLALARARACAPIRSPSSRSSSSPAAREPGRRDHDALLVEARRAGRHAARDLAADVGVVGAGGGEAGRAGRRGRGARRRDVGQVRAAPVGVVQDPDVAGLRAPRRAPPRPRRASRRGAPGCARPASPSRPSLSNSAVEASRRSLMLAECAARTSTAPISSQTARMPPSSTCSVTGSRPRLTPAPATSVPCSSTVPRPAGRHDGRRLRQLPDRRARAALARHGGAAQHRGLEPAAVEQRRAPAALQPSPAGAGGRSAASRAPRSRSRGRSRARSRPSGSR